MRCPQCGAETPDDQWNCVSCRINLYWAHQHFNELARLRTQQGLEAEAEIPSFLVRVSERELSDRARRGGSGENKVRQIARRVMRGESSAQP